MTALSVFCIAWGSGVMGASIYGYAKLGFGKLGLFVFLSGAICFMAGWL